MGRENQTNDVEKYHYEDEENPEVEGEVNLEEELISALEELRKSRKKNKLLKEQLLEYKKKQESRKE